jgi:triosephosphate isomerase
LTEDRRVPNAYTVALDERMQPLVAGNWKMHGAGPQLREIAPVKAARPPADVPICLPAPLIARAVQAAVGRIAIGGDERSAEISGAFTGDVSVEMLKDAGARAVIAGHSERSRHHGETAAVAKARAARRAGLLTIICIGETTAQRHAGKALSVCGDRVAGSVPESLTAAGTAIGYERLWAIGPGEMPTPEQIIEVHGNIRQCLVARLGSEGKTLRILYGGSAEPANAHAILALPNVGGVQVGDASLKAADFNAICEAAPAMARAKARPSLNRPCPEPASLQEQPR